MRAGYTADLIVVNGNPLENLKVLYPTGVGRDQGRQDVRTGGIEWTIKDGIPYHGPTLMKEVKEMVAKARAETGNESSAPVRYPPNNLAGCPEPNYAIYWVVDYPDIFFVEGFQQERAHIVKIGINLRLIFVVTTNVEKKIAEKNVNVVANYASPRA